LSGNNVFTPAGAERRWIFLNAYSNTKKEMKGLYIDLTLGKLEHRKCSLKG
jgi:hypothetical protein